MPQQRTLEELKQLMADALEDAKEWRRLADSTDIQWIYDVCQSKGRGCDQEARRWEKQLERP